MGYEQIARQTMIILTSKGSGTENLQNFEIFLTIIIIYGS